MIYFVKATLFYTNFALNILPLLSLFIDYIIELQNIIKIC